MITPSGILGLRELSRGSTKYSNRRIISHRSNARRPETDSSKRSSNRYCADLMQSSEDKKESAGRSRLKGVGLLQWLGMPIKNPRIYSDELRDGNVAMSMMEEDQPNVSETSITTTPAMRGTGINHAVNPPAGTMQPPPPNKPVFSQPHLSRPQKAPS